MTQNRFHTLFEANEGSALNGANETLAAMRKEAIGHFSDVGLPTRKTEAWKYTRIEKRIPSDVQIYLEATSPVPDRGILDRFRIPGLDAYVIATFNGRLVPELSNLDLPEEVTLDGLQSASEKKRSLLDKFFGAQADSAGEPFTALNTAFTRDGLFLHIPANTILEKPIHVIHLLDSPADVLIQPRMLYLAEERSQVSLIETFADVSSNPLLINAVTEWNVGANAHVDHYQVQEYGAESTSVQTLHVYQSLQSYFDTHTTTLKAGMLRNNLTIVPGAEECESHLFGFVLGAGSMHVDNHTLVDHKKPNCFSNELYKTILDDRATGVFNGKVFVRPDAQKTNAYQSNKSITLTQKARMYSKPELEIYADDVKCSHGATTGQLDAEALFYLRSRGLSLPHARRILLMAFARDVIDNIKIEALREYLDDRIAKAL